MYSVYAVYLNYQQSEGDGDVRGMGTSLVHQAAADPRHRARARGVRRGLGDRGVRQAVLRNSFTPPASQSQREADQASQVFGRNDADVVVLYRSATRTVGDPAYRRAVTAALIRLPRAEVARVSTYWSTGSPRLVSADRHATYAVLQLTGGDDAARQ